MKLLVSCLLFVFLALIHAQRPIFRCDYTYFKEIRGFLKYHKIPSNFNNARLRCEFEGSVLASPLNKPLREAMLLLSNRSSECGVFTGIHSIFSKGDFISIEGVPLSNILQNWAKGEPDNNKDEEDCIIMLNDGTLADYNCADTLPYLCYKKASPNMIMNACGTTDNGYQLDTRTKSCYKFHRYPRIWSRAYMTCAAEGAYLAIINSEVEVQVMKEIFAKNPSIDNVGDYDSGQVNIGFHDWNERGEWRTTRGQTLEEAGFNKFAPGEPNNYTTGEYCGAINRNGLLNDFLCDRRAAFICEKDPDMYICSDDDN